MAINNNPLLQYGQDIPEDLLQRILSGQIEGSKFSPSVSRVYDYVMQGTGDGGDMAPTNGRNMIYQPRNVSTWGGNDTADVWDEQGNYIGSSSGATDARNLARLVAMAVGGYYGTEYLNGLQGASGATAGGAGATDYGGAAAEILGGDAAGYTAGMGGAEAGIGSTLTQAGTGVKTAADALGGGKGLAALAGGVAGALDSGDKTASSERDPWAPAQPYLKGLLSEGADLYNQYKAQPFSGAQQAGYGNVGQILDLVNNNAGGLLSGFQANASGQNQFQRGQQRGLLGSTFQPQASQWRPMNFWDFGTGGK